MTSDELIGGTIGTWAASRVLFEAGAASKTVGGSGAACGHGKSLDQPETRTRARGLLNRNK